MSFCIQMTEFQNISSQSIFFFFFTSSSDQLLGKVNAFQSQDVTGWLRGITSGRAAIGGGASGILVLGRNILLLRGLLLRSPAG